MSEKDLMGKFEVIDGGEKGKIVIVNDKEFAQKL